MKKMSFDEKYSRLIDVFERYAEQTLANLLANTPSALRAAILYAFNGGGKRIRPVLFLHFYSKRREIDDEALNFALAIECLHNYTLIHDDLPCMDDDEYRRGNPTVHIKFGETIAVLAGDALLNMCYELLARGASLSKDKTNYAEAVSYFASNVGPNGLIGGQTIDTCIANPDKNDLYYVYKHKTGDLFAACCKCAEMLCGGDGTAAEEFGYALGFLFQASDDALDDDDDFSAKKILPEGEFERVLTQSKQDCLSAAKKTGDDFLISLTNKIAERKN